MKKRTYKPKFLVPCVQALIAEISKIDAYRRWFYAGYGSPAHNAAFKAEWSMAFFGAGLDAQQVRDGVAAWHAKYGDAVPPSAIEFVALCRPKLTDVAAASLSAARAALGR